MARIPSLGAIALAVLAPAFPSDTILIHGHIYTGNPKQPWAQALAITKDKLDAVGSDDEVMAKKEGKTKVIDLHGRTVIPGLIDSHTHMWFGALALHGFNLATPEEYIEPKDADLLVSKIKAYAASHPKDKVLFGRVPFDNTVTHELLDRAVADRPIVIHNPTEHTYWVNGKTLALAGITDAKLTDPNLERFIVRDPQGHPTGVIRETAMQVVENALPALPINDKVAWLRDASRYLNRYGITSVTNATGNLAEIQLYGMLHDKGELTVRTRTAFGTVAVAHKLTPEFLKDLDTARTKYHDDWVSANLIKFFSDGAGGPPLYEPAEFANLVLELDKRGYQIMTHALGAPSVKMVLNGYEKAEEVNGARDRRFRIEHAINVAQDDLARFSKLGVTASMQTEFCCFVDPAGSRTNAWQTFEKSGAVLALGSDWPCTWPPDPFSAIQQAATRRVRRLFTAPNPSETPAYTSPEERLTVEQAINGYTRGSAYARMSDDRLGTLEPGKLADLAVLSQDAFTVPATDVGKTKVLMTMVGGKTVYGEVK